jgi:hypothetical protein
MVQPRPSGLLRLLTPDAFEAWVGDRLRDLDYDVRLTPYQGDHGADLLATRDGETTVVQCKHRPTGVVGEPVLRDLYGAMHHFGAARALLVTTGSVSRAAREWMADKPMEAWDAYDLQQRWAPEIAQTTEALAAAPPAVTPTGAKATGRSTGQSAWYVCADGGQRYAVRLPRSIGDHPALGFEPLTDPTLPILPASAHMYFVVLKKVGDYRRTRTVPVGSIQVQSALIHKAYVEQRRIEFVGRDGTTTSWQVSHGWTESTRAAIKRAREMGGAPRLRGEAARREGREQIARVQEERRRRQEAQSRPDPVQPAASAPSPC